MSMRLPLDTRKRINLSKFLPKKSNVHAVLAHREGNKIILELTVEIPANESWIYENPKVYKAIQQGMKEAQEGKTVARPSFAEFADDEI
jgi:light-regulated signal transduction histidine kinase (bacteriophytochrome)